MPVAILRLQMAQYSYWISQHLARAAFDRSRIPNLRAANLSLRHETFRTGRCLELCMKPAWLFEGWVQRTSRPTPDRIPHLARALHFTEPKGPAQADKRRGRIS